MVRHKARSADQWFTLDLHLHTPASTDFQQAGVSYLDILQKAEQRGLDIIAFTDHNTVAGYRKMVDEIQQLELLSKLGRILPDERKVLEEYHRLNSKLLILPGFEFTATFGFHILCIFSPEKPVRELEHLLLELNIPPDQLDEGSQTVGATSDALTVYKIINQHGGLVIAAHANSSNGVAMRGFNFGGQTKIAFTQDPNLHALEVTDLDQKGARSTAAFFNGTKPEYPRRMHCIQGSDAHRLTMDPSRKRVLGVGERATDVLLPNLSFESLLDLFTSDDFSRTRPHRHKEEPAFDFIQSALEEGANLIQDFHESMTIRGGKIYAILADVCAFANTNGGTLYIGLTGDPMNPPIGVTDAEQGIRLLEKEINNRISPPLHCKVDLHEHRTKKIIRILVPRGIDSPYAVDDNKIYVRDEAETGLAVRDEIVNLVLRDKTPQPAQIIEKPSEPEKSDVDVGVHPPHDTASGNEPKTGVEVLSPTERQGKQYFTMRDLRNGNVVKNVTMASARKLWHYAITRYNEMASNPAGNSIIWDGEYGLVRKYQQGNFFKYDLVQRTPRGIRYYFGVTEDGIHGEWKKVTGVEEG